jgi:hypothetical protein
MVDSVVGDLTGIQKTDRYVYLWGGGGVTFGVFPWQLLGTRATSCAIKKMMMQGK